MARDDGGAAFPRPMGGYLTKSGHRYNYGAQGMSLRDYFAAAALQGLLAAPDPIGTDARNHSVRAAAWAYELADAMLAERKEAP